VPLKQLSSQEVAWLLEQVGIFFKRHGKEDIYEGYHKGKLRVVVVPRNRKQIPKGTLSSVLRQAGITKEEAEEILARKGKRQPS
jgi:predicted RNA binding protein YcfA (HicA-like mRNA interferase family)